MGAFYVTEAIFKVTIRLRERIGTNPVNAAALGADSEFFLTLEDYLVYNDVSFYGTEKEKSMLTFMMLDKRGNNRVDLDGYRHFWQQYIYMYGIILH